MLKGGKGCSSIFSIYCSGQCYKMLQTLGFQKYGVVVYRAINPVPLSKRCLTGVRNKVAKGFLVEQEFPELTPSSILVWKTRRAKWWTKNL